MKFILIFTLATIVNCSPENDVDSMTRIRRVKRIDDPEIQETTSDYTRIETIDNHEDMKYRGQGQYDYEGEVLGNGYEGYYEDDYYYELEKSNKTEKGSALKKFRKLVQRKSNAIITVKLHNFSHCVPGGKSGSRKESAGSYSDFDNLLRSVFPENFSNDQKRIHLYVIEFSAKGPRLFDTKDEYKFVFKSENKRKVIKKGTKLATTDENAILDVRGKVKLRLKFILGKERNKIREKDGSKTIFFDPQLRISYNCFRYSVLGFSSPGGLSSKKRKMIRRHFSKLMSNPKDVEKFIKAHKLLPEYKISTQEISTGPKDNVIFDMFKPFVKETEKDTVQICLCKAAEAVYKHTTKAATIRKYMYRDVKIPDEGFFDNVRDTARPPMRSLFNQALVMLNDKAEKITKGGDIGRIRSSIMKSLHRLFQEHRNLTGNNEEFHKFENHFGVFKSTTKQKNAAN